MDRVGPKGRGAGPIKDGAAPLQVKAQILLNCALEALFIFLIKICSVEVSPTPAMGPGPVAPLPHQVLHPPPLVSRFTVSTPKSVVT